VRREIQNKPDGQLNCNNYYNETASHRIRIIIPSSEDSDEIVIFFAIKKTKPYAPRRENRLLSNNNQFRSIVITMM